MAHQFEVTQAEKSFFKVRHPVEGITFTFHVVEGHGGRRALGGALRQKGAVASKAAHCASRARAFRGSRGTPARNDRLRGVGTKGPVPVRRSPALFRGGAELFGWFNLRR